MGRYPGESTIHHVRAGIFGNDHTFICKQLFADTRAGFPMLLLPAVRKRHQQLGAFPTLVTGRIGSVLPVWKEEE